jgi:hypothetical protein
MVLFREVKRRIYIYVERGEFAAVDDNEGRSSR